MKSEFKVYSASAGSGKTFTLVKEYLKILLTSSDDYTFRSILAITFTNKAAAEMKQRVLAALEEFAEVDLSQKWPDLFDFIQTETAIEPHKIKAKSKRVLNLIMQNYAALSITTIDSFTHRLIRTFAFDLGIPLNFEIEMDQSELIAQAVDLLLDKLGNDKEITTALNRFVKEKIDQDSDWNITRDLNAIAGILTRENDAREFRNYEAHKLQDFIALEKALFSLEKAFKEELQEAAKKALKTIDEAGIQPESFSRKTLYNQLLKTSDISKIKISDIKTSSLEKFLDGADPYSKATAQDQKDKIDAISSELHPLIAGIYQLITQDLSKYILYQNLRKELIPLSVLNQIALLLEGLKTDSNIKFIAEFNQIISDTIKDQPAPFIYEKLGIRYRYFFIDEMQDTSELQWQNLIPLLQNALAGEDAMVMLVGDGKQSIYRFRGGKAEQFIELSEPDTPSKFHLEKNIQNLDTNFRSYDEVVHFNNAFFTYLANHLEREEYQNMYRSQNNQEVTSKKGGYVSLQMIEGEDKEEILLDRILHLVENRDKRYKLGDICILVRKKSHGIEVADFLSEKGYGIVSSETLRVTNSAKVNFLIDVLSSMSNKEDRQVRMRMMRFLAPKETENLDAFFERFSMKSYDEFEKEIQDLGYAYKVQTFQELPFYDGLEYIIRCFGLNAQSDAYLQFFLDFVFEYQLKHFPHVDGFLSHWELHSEKLAIVAPENDEAITVMTIHKSKGLEFPMVISAFSHSLSPINSTRIWATMPEQPAFDAFAKLRVPVSKGSEGVSDIMDKELSVFHEEFNLDNLNLIYVAFTRASEQLHVLMQKPSRGKSSYEFLESFLNANTYPMEGEDGHYFIGSPERPEGAVKNKDRSNLVKQKTMISTPWKSHDIRVLQEGSKYWDSKQGEAINFGNKVHEIMAEIQTYQDQENAIDRALTAGLINEEEAQELTLYIAKICEHPELKSYFEPGKKVYTERTMVGNDGEILIPDRLVFEGDKVSIIDYKTGEKNIKYRDQIDGYAYVLKQMGYQIDKKILIYASNPLDVEVY